MTSTSLNKSAAPRVLIVGGGLAGMAACAALVDSGLRVELVEARRHTGGRAASFRDPASGEFVDHCQHVSMGCCTNLTNLCQLAGLESFFRRDPALRFIGPAGTIHDVAPTRWIPAPFHLFSAFGRLNYLSRRELVGISTALKALARINDPRLLDNVSIADWLRSHDQSERAIDLFWSVVLVGALGDALDRCSAWLARHVFVVGFINHRSAYELLIPTEPLAEIFGRRLPEWLASRGANLRVEEPVSRVRWRDGRVEGVETYSGQSIECDALIVAAPWFRVAGLIGDDAPPAIDALKAVSDREGAPIAGAHLWFDRPICEAPHAVLAGRLSQWIFRPSFREREAANGFYYQVVISGARELAERPRQETIDRIVVELRAAFPSAVEARLLQWRLVNDPQAVPAPAPGQLAKRPYQTTAVDNFFLAGDWTDTGWPPTMEGAVRSGRLAAEALLARFGVRKRLVTPDLPAGRIARWFTRPAK